MANLNKIFGAFTSGSVQIQSEDDSDTVKYIFADEKTGKNQKYELRLMDLDVEQLGIPEQDYQATFTMPSNEFTKIVKDLLIIGESVTIDVKKSGVTFRAEGEIGKSEVHLEKGEAVGDSDDCFNLEVNDPIELSFATQYLKKFTAAGPLARDVTIALSADVPMVIAYEVEDFC